MATVTSVYAKATIAGQDLPLYSATVSTPANGVPSMTLVVPMFGYSGEKVVYPVTAAGEKEALAGWQENTMYGLSFTASLTLTINGRTAVYKGLVTGVQVGRSSSGSQSCTVHVAHFISLLSRASVMGLNIVQAVGNVSSMDQSVLTSPSSSILTNAVPNDKSALKQLNLWEATKSYLRGMSTFYANITPRTRQLDMMTMQLQHAINYIAEFEARARPNFSSLKLASIPYLSDTPDAAFGPQGIAAIVASVTEYPNIGAFLWERLGQQLLQSIMATAGWGDCGSLFYDPTNAYGGSQRVFNISRNSVADVTTFCTNPTNTRCSNVYFIGTPPVGNVSGTETNDAATTGIPVYNNTMYAMYPEEPRLGVAMAKTVPQWIATDASPININTTGVASTFSAAANRQSGYLAKFKADNQEANRSVNEVLYLMAKDLYTNQVMENYKAEMKVILSDSPSGIPLGRRISINTDEGPFLSGYADNVDIAVTVDNNSVQAVARIQLTHVLFK